ncbi:unnamed protein product [Auanema sp. JU1783]|nr:unnamed protein product [Auanema sp. JU1783]
MSIKSQLYPRKLRLEDRTSKASSVISEKTIYSPSVESPCSETESGVNQLEIHEASVDVAVGQSREEYRQSLISMESSVSQVRKSFEEIDLIKQLEMKVNKYIKHGNENFFQNSSLYTEGFGELIIHKDIKMIESSDYNTKKVVYRAVYLFQKYLVFFKHGDSVTYEKSYPVSELILNSIITNRNDEQASHPEPALRFIRQTKNDNRFSTPIRYINIYFKKKSDADEFAKAFMTLLERFSYTSTESDDDGDSHYARTAHLDKLYYGILTGPEATKLLLGTPNGTFLIRFGTNQMRFAIAVSFESKVYHLRIEESPQGNVYLDEEFQFRSIKDLVRTYRRRSLQECFAHLPLCLKSPYKECQFYRVIHPYSPSEECCLNIRNGDIIQLLDSSMEQSGWLFGRMVVNGINKDGLFPITYTVKHN